MKNGNVECVKETTTLPKCRKQPKAMHHWAFNIARKTSLFRPSKDDSLCSTISKQYKHTVYGNRNRNKNYGPLRVGVYLIFILKLYCTSEETYVSVHVDNFNLR